MDRASIREQVRREGNLTRNIVALHIYTGIWIGISLNKSTV